MPQVSPWPASATAQPHASRMSPVTTREKAQKLLDELPEDELEPIVEIMASRSENDSTAAAGRACNFLISVADGTSGLDLNGLRTVRDRAWR